MPTNTVIDIPPASNETVDPGTITFDVSSNCTVCFGTANPAGSFPDLENETFEWTAGSSYGPYAADTANANLPYNTSAVGTPCSTVGPWDAVKTIHIGSGFGSAKTKTKTKAKATSKAKPKPKAKAAVVSKAKPAPKTKAKSKAKSKPKKAMAKPKTKAKTKAKAKPKAKKGGKKR
jgi:hypothetical protein